MIIYLLQWWYAEGWLGQAKAGVRHIDRAFDFFSIDILIRTLFAPWKQTITTTIGDEGLDAQIKAAIDNIVSRGVGLFVRLSMLFFGILYMGLLLIFMVAFLVIWPLIPFMPIIVLLWGLGTITL